MYMCMSYIVVYETRHSTTKILNLAGGRAEVSVCCAQPRWTVYRESLLVKHASTIVLYLVSGCVVAKIKTGEKLSFPTPNFLDHSYVPAPISPSYVRNLQNALTLKHIHTHRFKKRGRKCSVKNATASATTARSSQNPHERRLPLSTAHTLRANALVRSLTPTVAVPSPRQQTPSEQGLERLREEGAEETLFSKRRHSDWPRSRGARRWSCSGCWRTSSDAWHEM